MTDDRHADGTADRQIASTRVFDAPRPLVFKMFTDPRHLSHWWGPRGFTTTTFAMDVRPGGEWRYVMHGPDGTDYDNRITYLEVAEPECLRYRHGGGGDTAHIQFDTTIRFTDAGPARTQVEMRMVFPTKAARDDTADKYGAVEGLHQTLDRLGERLAARQSAAPEFVLTRTFDAPRDVVYRAWTDAAQLLRWFGPRGFPLIACNLDLRPGGVHHYGMRSASGQEMWGLWKFREVIPPQRLVFVMSFSDPQGGVARSPFPGPWPLETLSTVVFAEDNGRTILTLRAVPLNATQAERDAFEAGFASMTGGWTGTLDQLVSHLASVR